jgi:hypothetical protein
VPAAGLKASEGEMTAIPAGFRSECEYSQQNCKDQWCATHNHHCTLFVARHCGNPCGLQLKLERIAFALSSQLMQFAQRPSCDIAAAAKDHWL